MPAIRIDPKNDPDADSHPGRAVTTTQGRAPSDDPGTALAVAPPVAPRPTIAFLDSTPNSAAGGSSVTAALGRIAKEGYNNFHRYAYASIDDMRAALSKHLGEAGLTVRMSEHDIKFIAQGKLMCVTYAVWLEHSSGERTAPEYVSALGMLTSSKGGLDDKAISKCRSLAWKDWAKTYFCIATGDDPDADDGDAEVVRPEDRPATDREQRNGRFDDGERGGCQERQERQERPQGGDTAERPSRRRERTGTPPTRHATDNDSPRRGNDPVNNADDKLDRGVRRGGRIGVPRASDPKDWAAKFMQTLLDRVEVEADLNSLIANEGKTLRDLAKDEPALYEECCIAAEARAEQIGAATPAFPA